MLYWIFWISLGILFYTYAGYGLLLLIYLRTRPASKKAPMARVRADLPGVTMVVAAYNEAEGIARKVENSLALRYPPGKLDFIFVSDGSTDQTAAILDSYQGIRHFHQPERKGKVHALNRVMKEVNAPIVVFTDANAILNEDALEWMVRHYEDPSVGGVAGEKKVVGRKPSTAGSGEGVYWKYESSLKKIDAEFYSIVGAAGELFSIRTRLYEPMKDDTILDDFYQSLRLCLKGYRIAYEPNACATEAPSASIAEEYIRKVRISAGGFQAMVRLRALFNPFPHFRLSFLYFSHRVLRWAICPIALILLLVSNFLIDIYGAGFFYIAFLWSQLAFYVLALVGWILALLKRPGRAYSPLFYFLFMNIAVIQGFMRFLRGRQTVNWVKSRRENEP